MVAPPHTTKAGHRFLAVCGGTGCFDEASLRLAWTWTQSNAPQPFLEKIDLKHYQAAGLLHAAGAAEATTAAVKGLEDGVLNNEVEE